MMVSKRADASTLAVVNQVKANLPAMQASLPEGIKLRFDFDQSTHLYYPAVYHRPGPEVRVYRLNRCVQGVGGRPAVAPTPRRALRPEIRDAGTARGLPPASASAGRTTAAAVP